MKKLYSKREVNMKSSHSPLLTWSSKLDWPDSRTEVLFGGEYAWLPALKGRLYMLNVPVVAVMAP